MIEISVVIPLFNKEAYIKRAIDSVLGQSFQAFEVIVVDDGSTDNGIDSVSSIEDRRLKIIRQNNRGVSAARNRGISEASADLIAFLDADDAWKPHFLETVLRLRRNYPEAGLYSTAYEIIEPNGRLFRPKFKAIPASSWEGILPSYFESALGVAPVCASSVAIPQKVFSEIGKFSEGEKMGEDLEMWLRVALKYPIVFSNAIAVAYRRDSVGRACLAEYSTSDYKIVKTAREAILDDRISTQAKFYLTEYVYMIEIERAGRCIVMGESRKARKILQQCNTQFFKTKRLIFYFVSLFPLNLILFLRSLKRRILRQQ